MSRLSAIRRDMVSKNGKRKIEYKGGVYYWYVRIVNNEHRVHIMSDDKKVKLDYPFFDSEIPITPQVIRQHLNEYYDHLSQF